MTTKHTPREGKASKWEIIDDIEYDCEREFPIRALVKYRQAIHAIGKPWIPERLAIMEGTTPEEDALIVVAPELLKALRRTERALSWFINGDGESDIDALVEARHVISKVGTTNPT
jgi:hypothetical protein